MAGRYYLDGNRGCLHRGEDGKRERERGGGGGGDCRAGIVPRNPSCGLTNQFVLAVQIPEPALK